MGTKVTLTIPDYIYQQAKHVADANRRPLSDVINEALAQAFPAVHVNPDRPAMERELAAFRAMRQELLDKYEGQYVAVHQERVVDHDKDRLALVARVDEAYPGEVVLIKRVTPETYTEEREHLFGHLTLDDILAEIRKDRPHHET